MNNRLNIQDLAAILSDATGKERREIELFLNGLVVLVSEGVYRDKIAKVKGLGTFKVISVGQRESVNVNSGERIVIPGHYKFSFVPDKELRELVNKPFSIFETTELNDNVDFSDIDKRVGSEDPDELIEDMEEIQVEENNPTVAADVEAEPVIEDESAAHAPEEAEPVVDELSVTEDAVEEEKIVEEPANDESTSEEPYIGSVEQPEVLSDNPNEGKFEEREAVTEIPKKDSTAKKKSFAFFLFVFISHVFMAVAYFVYKYYEVKDYSACSQGKAKIESAAILDKKEILTADSIAPTMSDSLHKTEEKEINKGVVTPAQGENESLGSVKIKHGDRLTVIALQYYGNKLFWVYIYQHNKSLIDDPNNVPIGTVIEIPAPALYDIDAKDPESRKRAAELQTEILTGKRL